jgi:hypothetical protein
MIFPKTFNKKYVCRFIPCCVKLVTWYLEGVSTEFIMVDIMATSGSVPAMTKTIQPPLLCIGQRGVALTIYDAVLIVSYFTVFLTTFIYTNYIGTFLHTIDAFQCI